MYLSKMQKKTPQKSNLARRARSGKPHSYRIQSLQNVNNQIIVTIRSNQSSIAQQKQYQSTKLAWRKIWLQIKIKLKAKIYCKSRYS
jgi:hypothetical protein